MTKHDKPFRARHGNKVFLALFLLGLTVWILSWTLEPRLETNFALLILWVGIAFGWYQDAYERGHTTGSLAAWKKFNQMIDEVESNDQ